MSLGYPVVQGDMLQAELRVWGKPGIAQNTPMPPLPAPSANEWSGNNVLFRNRASRAVLSEGFTRPLASLPALSTGHKLTKVEVLGFSALRPAEWLVAVTCAVEDQSFTVYVQGNVVPEGVVLWWRGVSLHPDSAALLAAAGVKSEELARLVEQIRGDFSGVLNEHLQAVRTLLAQGVAPWPASALDGVHLVIEDLYDHRGDLLMTVRAR
jgi:hypothetical protein